MKKEISTRQCKSLYRSHDLRNLRFVIIPFLFLVLTTTARSQYLKRTLSAVSERPNELSTNTAHYYPLFGAGDENSGIIKAIKSYGSLVIDSAGSSKIVKFDGEEQILYVLNGTGTLYYDKSEVPVTKSDFIYIPSGIKFGFSNPREKQLEVVVMGFKISKGTSVKPTAGLMIANADNVPAQVLPSHGPTTQFQLLLGETSSKRDRLASAYQVTSLFIMDFAEGGTNNPHRHDKEEEIYLVIKGHGDMVAGETTDGNKLLLPSEPGDAYFYAPNTFVGFYSRNKEAEGHARILAVRFKSPAKGEAAKDR